MFYHIHNAKIWIALFIVLTLFTAPALAQSSVVQGVFFYSPSCPHCHEVMTNDWPGIQAEFGDQLQVLFIDVTTPAGSQIMQTARETMHIASNGVPMLILGTDILVGSIDIPQRAPGIIRAGLDLGGINYPPIPGIASVFQSALLDTPSTLTPLNQPTLFDDPANLAAVTVLVGLLASISIMGAAGWKLITRQNRHLIGMMNGLLGRRLAFAGTLVGAGVAGSLVLGSFENLITLMISGSVLTVFMLLAFHFFRSSSITQLANWLIPLTLVAGLLVAGYLAYIELTPVEATCGVFGDCNTVQQSSYARFLGIPVGIIGILGYLALMSLWLLNQYKRQSRIEAGLFVMTLLGVSFSIYLTFLEPFVIGASCAWCLSSAVLMGVLLWMTAPAGLTAIHTRWYAHAPKKRHGKTLHHNEPYI
jgi:uncharacterized membrane protein